MKIPKFISRVINMNMPPVVLFVIGVSFLIISLLAKDGAFFYGSLIWILAGIFEIFLKKINRPYSNWISLLCAFLIITFVRGLVGANYQSFKIPIDSMSPTLMTGDRVFVDKGAYKRLQPNRGDLIIFRYPEDTKKIFLKRLAGLPGETIEIKDGRLLINGAVLNDPALQNIYYYNRGDYGKLGQSVSIPKDSYYVLGDNSSSSRDSRYFGFVPKKNLYGKAIKIWYPPSRAKLFK